MNAISWGKGESGDSLHQCISIIGFYPCAFRSIHIPHINLGFPCSVIFFISMVDINHRVCGMSCYACMGLIPINALCGGHIYKICYIMDGRYEPKFKLKGLSLYQFYIGLIIHAQSFRPPHRAFVRNI